MAPKSCALAMVRLKEAANSWSDGDKRHLVSSKTERIGTAAKAGYVGSLVTPMRAVVGNASWGTFIQVPRESLAVGIDIVRATGQSAKGGFKVSPSAFREIASALDGEGMTAFYRGFVKGKAPLTEAWAVARSADNAPVSTFVNELRQRLAADVNVPNSAVEYKRTVYGTKFMQTFTDGAFAILEGADRPWWMAAFDTEMYRQAKLLGIKEGLKGTALKNRTAEVMSKPTDEMKLRANEAANYATFKDRNPLSQIATTAKQGIKRRADKGVDPTADKETQAGQRAAQRLWKAADLIAETKLPFTGVPSSVAGKMVSVSPFGVFNPDLYSDSNPKMARGLANAGAGFGMVAIGMMASDAGLLTGATPIDDTKRAQWAEAGMQPFSINIDALVDGGRTAKKGDTWVGLKILGPAASSLFMGFAMRSAQNEEPDNAPRALSKGVASSAEFLAQQTYLQSIGEMLEAIKGKGSIGRLAASSIPTPALIGQMSRAADPYVRDQSGFTSTVKSKIGLGHTNPRMMGPGGPLPKKTTIERIGAVASPFPFRTSRDTPLLQELRRLGISFGFPGKTTTVNKERVRLSDDEWREFVRAAGPETIEGLSQILNDPQYADASDAERKAAMDATVREVRAAYREQIKRRIAEKQAKRGK